jgi:hypothetical protein
MQATLSLPTATPINDAGLYGPARGIRLTADEQEMLNDLTALYGETASEVLRIALRHLYERLTGETPIPEPKVA